MGLSKTTVVMKDHSSVNGSCSINTSDLSALDGAALLAIRAGFEVAVKALSTGSHQSSSITDVNVASTNGQSASNVNSINKNKMVFKFHDSTNAAIKGSCSIPAADNQWEIAGTNNVDITAIPVAAMITFLEATALSQAGNSVVVYDVVMG